MADCIRVLSIDGGGIRGLIPAMVLREIERRTGRAIAEMFDLIAGTSTGGILALGLTMPDDEGKPNYAAADMVKLYAQEGERIFSRSVWHRIRAVGNLAEEKYPADGIEAVLKQYFEDARLRDALTEVIVTSYDIEARRPYFFKRARARADATRDCALRQAARATSAAPTYFEPFRLDIEGEDAYRALVDGGVFANNPAMCAYAEAKAIHGDARELMVVSLGTGELTRRLPHEDAVGWGLAQWAQPLLNVVFDGVSDAVDYQLRTLLPRRDDAPRRYYRLQTRLSEDSDDMDDASSANMRVLKLLADELINREEELLDELCAALKE